MKAIQIMFDSLIKDYVYNTELENFKRLLNKTTVFNNAYCGSLPCMPARRELHTGRYNFLHNRWGPLELYDESAIKMLSNNNIYTHIITDHKHYFNEGGAGYIDQYDSYKYVRGQAGDNNNVYIRKENRSYFKNYSQDLSNAVSRDTVNRSYISTSDETPMGQLFNEGLDFLKRYHEEDNWFLTIESFDPHEPFTYTDDFKHFIDTEYHGKEVCWPAYGSVEDDDLIDKVRKNYLNLLRQCDYYLGKILDAFDRYNLWEDTMLIINTDHGFLLGEHNFFGKSSMPTYNEVSNIPFLFYHPKVEQVPDSNLLVQTIDIPVTLLDHFNIKKTNNMQGISIIQSLRNKSSREYVLYGFFGSAVYMTDGEYTLVSGISKNNQPLHMYSSLPTLIRERVQNDEDVEIDLVKPFSFMKNTRVLKVKVFDKANESDEEISLFKVSGNKWLPCEDDIMKIRMKNKMIDLMKQNDCPQEQFERLNLL